MDEDDIIPASQEADESARERERKDAIGRCFYVVSITATPASLLLSKDGWLGPEQRMQVVRMPVKPNYYGLCSAVPEERRVQHMRLAPGKPYSKDPTKVVAGEMLAEGVQTPFNLPGLLRFKSVGVVFNMHRAFG
jgi:hypothetical protein